MAKSLCNILKQNNVYVLRHSSISAFHDIIVILGCDENWVKLLKNGKDSADSNNSNSSGGQHASMITEARIVS